MFKIGDRVVCTHPGSTKQLKAGARYTVSAIADEGTYVKVEPLDVDHWFSSFRFRSAPEPQIIGLCGRATAGKDATAAMLAECFGYQIYGWADPMYKFALWANPRIWLWRRLRYYVDNLGWTAAKRIPAIRQYLQSLGTEGGRECLDEDVWVMIGAKKIQAMLPKGPVVITNCRYANEAEWVISQGGVIVKVTRPGVEACNGHSSEAGEADSFAKYELINDGTLVDLKAKVKAMMEVI